MLSQLETRSLKYLPCPGVNIPSLTPSLWKRRIFTFVPTSITGNVIETDFDTQSQSGSVNCISHISPARYDWKRSVQTRRMIFIQGAWYWLNIDSFKSTKKRDLRCQFVKHIRTQLFLSHEVWQILLNHFFCNFTCVILYCWLRTVEFGSGDYPLEGAAVQTTACPVWLNGNGRPPVDLVW